MIRLEGLRVQAGEFALAIDGLSVGRGEYLMILGPTASGKTVLLETVAGLRRSQAGRIWFGEREVTGQPPERRRAGLVYQDYALFPHLTVAGNIGFGLRGRNGGGRIGELANLVGIDGLLGRYPEGLSGGERQRVALARALAIQPEVLLLDEPLAALDGPTRLELQEELKRIQREMGTTVMHVTHDLDEALALGDRVAVLINGELRQVGDPRQVTRSPVDVEVASLVGLKNVYLIAAASAEDPGSQAGEGRDDGGHRDRRRVRWRVQLDGGREIFAEEVATAGPSEPLFALVRADEIALELVGGRPVVRGSTSGGSDGAGASGGADCDNVLEGTVRAVQIQSMHASIEVEVPSRDAGLASLILAVHVLPPQVDVLGIEVGVQVRLRFPGSAVHICRESASGSRAQFPA
jgi:ABC-type Fe3+/spermidine/putrescine transport system ATPase subunit